MAQASNFEFIANNPGDWQFHCHAVHHMLNHMVGQVVTRIRKDVTVDRYLANLDTRPTASIQDEIRTQGRCDALEDIRRR